MLGVIATFSVRDGKQAEFEACFSKLTPKVLELEPGAKSYALYRVKGDPAAYKVIEIYESEAAFAEHRDAAHLKAAVAEFGPLLAGKAQVDILEGV